jgi:hypothetical protein
MKSSNDRQPRSLFSLVSQVTIALYLLTIAVLGGWLIKAMGTRKFEALSSSEVAKRNLQERRARRARMEQRLGNWNASVDGMLQIDSSWDVSGQQEAEAEAGERVASGAHRARVPDGVQPPLVGRSVSQGLTVFMLSTNLALTSSVEQVEFVRTPLLGDSNSVNHVQ